MRKFKRYFLCLRDGLSSVSDLPRNSGAFVNGQKKGEFRCRLSNRNEMNPL